MTIRNVVSLFALAMVGTLLPAGCAFSVQASSQAAPPTTLEKLDAASARFVSAEAKVHRDAYNAFIKDSEASDGSMYFIRQKDGKTEVGIVQTGKTARTVAIKDGVIRDYNPGTKCYDTVTKADIDAYLTLGFGGSGKELAKAWDVNDLGSEQMAGVKVEKLELTPKDTGVKANIKTATLWVDLDRDVTLKQIFLSPNGDKNTATYSIVSYNKSINTKPYAIPGKPCGK